MSDDPMDTEEEEVADSGEDMEEEPASPAGHEPTTHTQGKNEPKKVDDKPQAQQHQGGSAPPGHGPTTRTQGKNDRKVVSEHEGYRRGRPVDAEEDGFADTLQESWWLFQQQPQGPQVLLDDSHTCSTGMEAYQALVGCQGSGAASATAQAQPHVPQQGQDPAHNVRSAFQWLVQSTKKEIQATRQFLSPQKKRSLRQEFEAGCDNLVQELGANKQDASLRNVGTHLCRICCTMMTDNPNHICGNPKMTSGCGVKLQIRKAYGQHVRQWLHQNLTWEEFWAQVQQSVATNPPSYRNLTPEVFHAELERAARYLFETQGHSSRA